MARDHPADRAAARPRPKKLDYEALREYALRLLTARNYSVAELRDRLRRRAARASDAVRVVERLRELGYLDDRKYAELYARLRLENDGFGQSRVVRDLIRKKIPRQLAEEAAAEVFAGADEEALIEGFLERKYRKVSLPEHLAEPRNLASVYRRLRYAGFSGAGIIRVLRRYSEQAESLDGAGEAEEL